VLFNALLCQADRDLAEIARILGEDPTPFEQWAKQTAQAINNKLWDEEHGIYIDYDLVAKTHIHTHVVAGFLPLFAGIPDADRAQKMYNYLNTSAFWRLDEDAYPIATYNRNMPDFEATRYWRGPAWINIDWLLYHGLKQYGYTTYAEHMRDKMITLVQNSGFYEYFNPLNGEGHGTYQFSWTAALLIDWIKNEILA
jgi:neutral trehalase